MRQLQVSGFLAADPEIKTARSGKNYASFRMSNHERNDKEDETFWTNVVSMETGGLIPHLKKGSAVIVTGDYSNHAYNSDKYGVQVDNSLIAWHIEFWGSKPKDQAGDTQAPAQSASPAPQQQAAAAPAKPAPKQAAAPVTMPTSSDDGLPF